MKPTTQERLAQMKERAQQAVMTEATWFTATELAALIGSTEDDMQRMLADWKETRQIFSICRHGIEYFPGFALDPAMGYRPVPALAHVLTVFGDTKDEWGLAYWFVSGNSWLGGPAPMMLLTTQVDRVMGAARQALAGVTHG